MKQLFSVVPRGCKMFFAVLKNRFAHEGNAQDKQQTSSGHAFSSVDSVINMAKIAGDL